MEPTHSKTNQPKASNSAQPLTYTLRECAEALKVSLNSFRKIVDNGEVKVVRVGKRVLIPVRELERYLNDNLR